MSDMTIATTVAKGSQPQALAGASTGAAANIAGGGNFWDLILSQLVTGKEQGVDGIIKGLTKSTGVTNEALTADAAALKKGDANPLALLQIALSNQNVDGNGNIVLPESTDGIEKLQTQLDLTNGIINHLKNALPENAENTGLFSQVLSKLQTKSDTLQASITALESGTLAKNTAVEDIPLPLMIALGLTPAEIAKVADHIDALEDKLGRDITVEDLIAGVGGIIPPAPETAVLATAGLKTDISSTLSAIDEDTMPTDDLAAQLNKLDVGAGTGEELAPEENATMKRADRGMDVRADAEAYVGNDNTNTHGEAKKSAATFKENLIAMANSAKAAAGEIVLPASLFGAETDGSFWQQFGVQASSALNFGTTAQAANLSATNASAGQTHPATQMVAATLTKAGKEGTSDTMTLKLDPPELGSVSVRLEFGKDKTVKAHLLVEKPETFMMLQRDGFTLERALQNAGFDARGSDISFELAQGGGDFNPQSGEGGGDENYSGGPKSGAAGEDEGQIVQSTMTWQVDSATGHVRYNIFA